MLIACRIEVSQRMHVPSRSPLALAFRCFIFSSSFSSFFPLLACFLLISKLRWSVSWPSSPSLGVSVTSPSYYTLSLHSRVALHSLTCTSASLAPVFNPAENPSPHSLFLAALSPSFLVHPALLGSTVPFLASLSFLCFVVLSPFLCPVCRLDSMLAGLFG